MIAPLLALLAYALFLRGNMFRFAHGGIQPSTERLVGRQILYMVWN